MITASYRKTKFGYKAVVVFDNERTHIPIRKNWATAELAKQYAQKYIDVNYDPIEREKYLKPKQS